MGQELKLIIFLIWLPQAIRQILAWLYWWQVKEYRFDRFRGLLLSLDGKKALDLNLIIFKLLILLISIIFKDIIWALLFVLFILDLKFFLEILNKKLRRPIFTQRAVLIFGTSLMFVFLVAGYLGFGNTKAIYTLVLGEIFLILSPGLGIFWTTLIVNATKKEEIIKAKERLQETKSAVIGITGSYGKTTTKEFVAHLLSQAYNTKKTTGSENTELGIARETVKSVNKNTEFYVVEMGAYKKGEIETLAQIVNPRIGIITGIEPQHLSLFGSLEQIKKTKFELIKSLPPDGIAVFNLSSKHCRKLAEEARRVRPELKVIGYYTSSNNNFNIKAEMESRILAADINGVTFEIKQKHFTKKLFAPVKGAHFVENLTGAILLAKTLGLTWKQIEKGCRTIKLPGKIMQTRKIKGNVYVINDTYNITPMGFESAIKYIALFEAKKKIVVTPGIIELGALSSEVHTKLAREMKDKVDQVILTQREFEKDIKLGLGVNKSKLRVIDDSKKLVNYIEQIIEKGKSVILLEGRVPISLINMIEKKKNV